ncbi:hypothetical protein [Arthrobacter sp. KK5.5]|uniref:hypothetical protein n=1 Tax=Arthrobacter sp. KK5.5 TaxID=3373084 RepID=UPI003EE437E3
MITAQKFRGRRAVAAAALATMALGATGCAAINPQATTMQYAPSDGFSVDIAGIQGRNMMLVANSADEEARLIGSLINSTDAPLTITLEVAENTVSIDVPADSTKKLEDDANKTIVPNSGAEPGALTSVRMAVSGASTQQSIPVVNGALAEYRPYLPGGYDESTVEHLAPHEETEEAH